MFTQGCQDKKNYCEFVEYALTQNESYDSDIEYKLYSSHYYF